MKAAWILSTLDGTRLFVLDFQPWNLIVHGNVYMGLDQDPVKEWHGKLEIVIKSP